ncbi:MAG: type II secretion system GspH family protein [Acidobacteria bacterium]|nr:type II secretion system GspH family protein [Acidobacteriota bacterium]
MTGKRIAGCGLGIADWKSRLWGSPSRRPHSAFRNPQSRGFTLLELMIVISILVILAMVAIGMYSKTVLAAKEATLRQDLHTMNRMLDQYAADKGKLPQSLEDLVGAGYLPEIPIDPITDQKDWVLEFGDDPSATDSSQGVVRVRSAATDASSDGTSRYNEW